jgi:predicted ATPase
MEISKIVIENFKGIERVELNLVRPINVLIGRNNSGKSSVLTGLKFLSQYFNTLKPKDTNIEGHSTIRIPSEYFRGGIEGNHKLCVSITVSWPTEERRKQFVAMRDAWNKSGYSPEISSQAIDSRIGDDLFSILTFDFAANPPKGSFGLLDIRTLCKDNKGDSTDVDLLKAQNPGDVLKLLPLSRLFVTPRGPCSLLDLKGRVGIEDRIEIHYEHGSFRSPQGSSVEDIFFRELMTPAFNHIREILYNVFLVSPYRHSDDKAPSRQSTELTPDGRNLVQYLHNLSLNKHSVFEDIADFVMGIVPEVGRLHPRFTGMQDDSLELAYDWQDGRMINLTNMGGGVEQLLILGCLLISQKTSCILWEEPESHLHPAAQEILLNELEKRVGNSVIFLTTQSPVFIRASEKVAVHAITNPDGKSARGRTLSQDDLHEAAALIGSRPGHLAQADIVVYVEGKTGAAIVEEWLQKWPDKQNVLQHLQLAVQSLNADEAGSNDFDLGKIMKVTPNMIVFVDSESEHGTNEPKEIRRKLKNKCDKLQIPCIFTELPQIEDYFTEQAVRKVLPEGKANSWVYDSKNLMHEELKRLEVSKKLNRNIACAMQWNEVAQHMDLMKIFDEIKMYANRLSPTANVET